MKKNKKLSTYSAGKEQYCSWLLRAHNAKQQLGTYSWQMMMQMTEAPSKEDSTCSGHRLTRLAQPKGRERERERER
jgi:hypothetical protein